MTKKGKSDSTIGNLIKTVRKTQGLSQMKLADKLGVSYQQVQKYENGATKMTVPRLAQISSALGISAYTLLSAEPAIAEMKKDISYSHKELKLIMLFRKLKSEKVKDGFIKMLGDFVLLHPKR